MITDIYRIKTANSIYEINVSDRGTARCRKENGFGWHTVQTSDMSFLDKLVIGASFQVPGVVLTSVVSDYNHLIVSDEPKRHAEVQTTMGQFFGETLVEAIKDQAMGHRPVKVHGRMQIPGDHRRVATAEKTGCEEAGCDYPIKQGPSHNGSKGCKSGSIASGGTRSHCSCDYCF